MTSLQDRGPGRRGLIDSQRGQPPSRLHWRMRCASALLACATAWLTSACNDDRGAQDLLLEKLTSRPPRVTPYDLQGLVVPGTKDDAKRLGFTDCSANDAFFYCQRQRPMYLYQVKAASSSLILDEMDNFVESKFSIHDRNPGVYSYRGIQLNFGRTFYDMDCIAKLPGKSQSLVGWPRPIQCRKNEGIDYFRYVLEQNGWTPDITGQGHVNAYYRSDIPLEIEISAINGTANVRPFPLKEAQLIVKHYYQNTEQTAAQKLDRDNFVRSMKQ